MVLPCSTSPSDLIYAHGGRRHASVHLFLGGSTAVASAQVALLAKSFRNKMDRCILPSVWSHAVFCARGSSAQQEEHSIALGRVALCPGWPDTSCSRLVFLRSLLIGNPFYFQKWPRLDDQLGHPSFRVRELGIRLLVIPRAAVLSDLTSLTFRILDNREETYVSQWFGRVLK